MKEIHIKDWSKQLNIDRDHFVLIDVRAPLEFKDGHIPGAINVPLFTNDERAIIGTLYKQKGTDHAKWKAMEIVSPKIPDLLQSIKEYAADGKEALIYCWRGGSRSGSVCTFAELAGLPVCRLTGGYKAYRTWCAEQLQEELFRGKKSVMLHGMTGVGKTLILDQLTSKGYPTLDLERLANHRGSIFGHFGLGAPHNQKTFDGLLIDRLLELGQADHLILEAESRRIGHATLPDSMMEWRKEGIHFLLKAPLSFRIKVIMQEYVEPAKNIEQFTTEAIDSFTQIKKRLKPNDRDIAEQMLKDNDFASFIELILVKYYDPFYQFHLNDYKGELIEIHFESIEEAVDKISKELARLLGKETVPL
jgi:tRNA 2-selenouridine synthase